LSDLSSDADILSPAWSHGRAVVFVGVSVLCSQPANIGCMLALDHRALVAHRPLRCADGGILGEVNDAWRLDKTY
jgi:hypothetical protein